MTDPVIRRKDAPPVVVVDGLVGLRVEVPRADGPLADLLDAAGAADGADHGTVCSGDGLFTASIPLDRLRAARLEAGRLQVPDAPTNCWNVKDVVRVELTAGKQPDSVDERSQARE